MGIVVVASFLGITALISLYTWWYIRNEKNDSTEEYFMAGRNVPWYFVTGSLLLTNLSAVHLVGMNGTAFKEGIVVAGWETLAAIACALMAFYFSRIYLGLKVTTSPEFLEKRFDATTRLLATTFFLIDYTVQDLPGALYTGAIAFNQIFSIQKIVGWEGIWGKFFVLVLVVWFIGLIGGLLAIFGGLKAVVVSDTINGAGMFIAGLSISIIGLSYIGNGNLIQGATTLYNSNPEKFDMAGGPDTSIPFSTNFTGMIVSQVYYWCFSQAMVQRVFAARNLHHAQKGVIVTGLIKVLVPLIVVLPGILAYHILEDERSCVVTKTCDDAFPRLLKKLVPPWAMGIYAAVIAGAVLSTFNSNLNSIATMITFGVYKKWISKDASDEEMLRIGRYAQLVCGIISMLIAPFYVFSTSVYEFLQSISPFWTCPMFAIFLVGMVEIGPINGHKISPKATRVCFLVCPLVYGFLQFLLPLTGVTIHFLHSQGIVALLGIIILHVHGLIWPLTSGEIHVMLKNIKKRKMPQVRESIVELALVENQEELAPNTSGHNDDDSSSFDEETKIEIEKMKPWPYVGPGALSISVFALSLYFIFHASNMGH